MVSDTELGSDIVAGENELGKCIEMSQRVFGMSR
jgi:hypothetical protein